MTVRERYVRPALKGDVDRPQIARLIEVGGALQQHCLLVCLVRHHVRQRHLRDARAARVAELAELGERALQE